MKYFSKKKKNRKESNFYTSSNSHRVTVFMMMLRLWNFPEEEIEEKLQRTPKEKELLKNSRKKNS